MIDEVRRRAGDDWVVGVRISLTDFIPGALDIEDAIRVGAAARGRRADRLRQRHRGRLPQHLQGDRACGRARRLPRRPHRAGEGGRAGAAGVHRRRHQGSGARRGDPRLGQGGHGRDDAGADRRPGVREQGARGTRGRARPLHPRQPGLHRPRLQGAADHVHRQSGRRARERASAPGRCPPADQPARWLVAGGGPGRDEGRRRRLRSAATR